MEGFLLLCCDSLSLGTDLETPKQAETVRSSSHDTPGTLKYDFPWKDREGTDYQRKGSALGHPGGANEFELMGTLTGGYATKKSHPS